MVWQEPDQVTIILEDHTIIFFIGYLTGGMDAPARIVNDRTMVPLRFISEALGADVEWCEIESRIDIRR